MELRYKLVQFSSTRVEDPTCVEAAPRRASRAFAGEVHPFTRARRYIAQFWDAEREIVYPPLLSQASAWRLVRGPGGAPRAAVDPAGRAYEPETTEARGRRRRRRGDSSRAGTI